MACTPVFLLPSVQGAPASAGSGEMPAGLSGVVFGSLSRSGSYNKPAAQTCSLEHSRHLAQPLNLGLFQQKSMCRGTGMRENRRMSWKKAPERADLPVIITVLLASQKTKIPEDDAGKTRHVLLQG